MLDIGYPIRLLLLLWRYKGQKRGSILSETVLDGRCWPIDLDIFFHMNNSRYIRECDFGRIGYFFETGLWDVLKQRKRNGFRNANMVVSALQSQFRQSIKLGDKFQIRTRLNGWDDSAFYLEQSIILHKNNQTAFSLLARIVLTTRSLTPQMLIDDLHNEPIQSPQLSPAMESFKQNYRLSY